MPEVAAARIILDYGGQSYLQAETPAAAAAVELSPSIPAAKIGQLTTRTDTNTGVLTMSGGHGITTGQKLDLFWDGGSRHGMTVGTVSTNSVPIDLGSGDDLPTNLTNITAMVPVSYELLLTGNNAIAIGAYSPKAGYVAFVDDGPADIAAAVYQLDADQGKSWFSGNGVTNPLASAAVTAVHFSHGDSTSAQTMKALVLRN